MLNFSLSACRNPTQPRGVYIFKKINNIKNVKKEEKSGGGPKKISFKNIFWNNYFGVKIMLNFFFKKTNSKKKYFEKTPTQHDQAGGRGVT